MVNMLATLIVCVLAQGSMDAQIAELLPTAAEDKCLSIPWRLNLSQARSDAQKSGKPIFMFIMNGHPMGCT